MKAVSIHQPWAWAILEAKPLPKDIENRTWKSQYKGTLYIHAGGSKASMRYLSFVKRLAHNVPDDFTFGAIVGRVELVDYIRDSKSPWAEDDWHWVLSNPESIATPIPCKGALSLWTPPMEIQEQILRSEFVPYCAIDDLASIDDRESVPNEPVPYAQLSLLHP